MDWEATKSITLSVMTVATIIATAGVGLMLGSLKGLRDTAADLRGRVGDLEKERAEDKADNAELKAENKLLTGMVQGKVEWVALTDLLEEHHRQAIVKWDQTDRHLTVIERAIDRTLKTIEDAVQNRGKSL